MTSFLQLAILTAIIITFAKLGGYLSYRLGQPSVLGELLVGIILGPSVLNIINHPYFTDSHLSESISHFAEIGVLLLMFLAGLDLHINDMLKTGKIAALSGMLGMVMPLGLGAIVGIFIKMELSQAIFIGLILSATSVSISAQTLMELKALRSRVGVSLLGAAVFDDILVLLGLSIFTALIQPGTSGGAAGIVWIIVKIFLFLGIASLLGSFVFPKLSNLVSSLPISQGLVALVLITILFYGWAAESFGQMAAITGAFLAGVWFGRTQARDHIHSSISIIAYSLFVPVFFINIGLSANVRELTWGSGILLLVLLLVAVVGKVSGAGFGAYWGGLTKREALQLGVGMMSRGEVGLIVATVGIELGLIEPGIFSVVVVIIILTTLLTPPLLRIMFQHPRDDRLTKELS